jgi:hypothetical protein
MEFTLNKVALKNVAFRFIDSTANKTVAFRFSGTNTNIKDVKNGMDFRTKGKVHFEQLTFNPKKGSFLKNTPAEIFLHLTYNQAAKQLQIQDSKIWLNNEPYQLSGYLVLGKPPVLTLNIANDKAVLKEVLPYLTSNLASKLGKFQINKPVQAAAKITVTLIRGSMPEAEVVFKTEKASVSYKEYTFTDVQLAGRFYMDSTKAQAETAYLNISDFLGRYEKIPIKANFKLTHLVDPDIDIKSTVSFSLAEANHLLDESKLVLNSGNIDLALTYKGKLQTILDESNSKLPGKLKGTFSVKKASFQYLPRQFQFTDINGNFKFDEFGVNVDTLRFLLNTNPMHISGKVDNFLPLVLYGKDKINAQVKMHLPSLNFNDFKSPGTLRKTGLLKEKEIKSKKETQKLLAQKIDALINNFECQLMLEADRVSYKNFVASQVKGNVVLEENAIQLQSVSMHHADGNFTVYGQITDMSQPVSNLYIRTKIEHADVRQMFHAFENFKQTTLEDKNLMGKLNADITFSTSFDDSYNIEPQTMKGNFYVHLANGRLINFEPMAKISKVVFKERDFTDIEFAQIENNFELNGLDLTISRMEIASSVLTLFVEGMFSFKKATDLSIQLPLRNLSFKKDKDIIPENIGVDQNAGASVYLRARAQTGSEKVKITYDPFKKGLKENRKQRKAEKQSEIE